MAPATIFAALGDPVRLTLLDRLKSGTERSMGEMGENLPITRQAVAKHLGVLQAGGLVEIRSLGRQRRVRLRPGAIAEANAYLDMVAKYWDDALGRLKVHVEKTP
ncbi:MAG TPA: metalloregulator ArsR/SmtB family transcription factor [Sphingobium sp.]|uniref:ArsR/SmtB family transcription factor n=1 Tax=Sphingobium sp. TaxID=1912891 RepID=UPI002ED3A22F